MSEIFERAFLVRVWLGDGDGQSDRAFSLIERLLCLEDFDELFRDLISPAEWAAFLDLLRRPWFSRHWIVHEISIARDTIVCCGTKCSPWISIANTASLFASRHEDLRRLFQKSVDFENHPNFLGEFEALGVRSLVDLTNSLFRKAEDGSVTERLYH